MKRTSLLICLALACILSLSGCQTTGSGAAGQGAAPAASAAKAAPKDPLADLASKMFLLPDGRDMSFAVVRVTTLGVSEKTVRDAARTLTFGDFRTFLNDHAGAHRVVYLGVGRFRVDVLRYNFGEEFFEQATYTLHLTRFVTEGKTIDGLILDNVTLDGRDFSTFASFKTYEYLLTRKVGL